MHMYNLDKFINYLSQNCAQPLDLNNYNDYDYGQHYLEVLYEDVIAPLNLPQDEADALLNIACEASDVHLQKMLERSK